MEWIRALTPFLAAIVAILGVYWTINQKDTSDRRAEWWRRVTWAIERTESEDDAVASIGFMVLGELLESKLATPSEDAIISALALHVAGVDNSEPETNGG
ncbi:MAG: hypothetical protein DI630_00850 [Gordonia sp. (in: high G+C Gram-positive bacteria)]|nr:MAG: hypothetical protein DI630_00850 [Gordonia sp. (in: high G+C Gram-positive bacteria)]